ncbi:hypothetical protein [Arcanobacterium phocae]|nr:hypothetical protein [Arcanobacterium phocae]
MKDQRKAADHVKNFAGVKSLLNSIERSSLGKYDLHPQGLKGLKTREND